jgi:hypothetical protein
MYLTQTTTSIKFWMAQETIDRSELSIFINEKTTLALLDGISKQRYGIQL